MTRGETNMSELLAPAGSMEALKAAVANGCDTVYLGMTKFGARAYSANFDEEALVEAVAYAHLRDVKVYVAVNTIVFEDELADMRRQLDVINEAGADGVIVQDLAALEYVVHRFEDMEAHCSTQMGVDDVQGALLCKELGARRVVLAREADVEKVKQIRRQADIPVEVFVYGALCVSYSGNCIMSGMTGNRSGNRGRCIGSCRKLYDIVELDSPDAGAGDAVGAGGSEDVGRAERGGRCKDDGSGGVGGSGGLADSGDAAVRAGKKIGRGYLLSTKDLNTIERLDQLREVDSLKIEGRMKEAVYVANAVSRFRMALDGTASDADKEKLNRTFNRTYTEGYLFREDRGDIVNVEKPNHFGYRVGEIVGFRKGMCEIRLTRSLRQNDLVRIRHGEEDVNLALARIYDRDGRLVNGAAAGSSCYIKVKERLSVGDVVYKTKDFAYERELETRLEGEFRRFPLDVEVRACPGEPLYVAAEGFGCRCVYEGDELLSEAVRQPTMKDAVVKQLSRLNDTVFFLNNVEYEPLNAFVPAKQLNAARKRIVESLCSRKLASKKRRLRLPAEPAAEDGSLFAVEAGFGSAATGVSEPAMASCFESASKLASLGSVVFESKTPYLCAFVTTQEQFDACRECGVEKIYFRNFVPRNGATYRVFDDRWLRDEASASRSPGAADAPGAFDGSGLSGSSVAPVASAASESAAVPASAAAGVMLGCDSSEEELLVGGLGGVRRYGRTGRMVTDYSLNVVNSKSCYELHRLGARRVTLSYEINERQLRDLIAAYRRDNGGYPALEMIVYGHAPLLVTKHCPLKRMGLCGSCRTKRYELRDGFARFPLVSHDNCDTTVLNGKVLNLLDEMPGIAGVEAFRLNFTLETAEEVRRVVARAQAKLSGELGASVFDPKTDTRGYFNKEIL